MPRNFGHQAAITAGLRLAAGELVLIMDDDLEDPPEIIPQFIDKAHEGYDVVFGVRKGRKIPLPLKFMFAMYYRLLYIISDIKMPYDSGDFCLMKRVVVTKLNSMPESNRYLRGMRSWLGFRQTGIEYERGSRLSGKSGYSIFKYCKLGFDGIFSFSYKPLYLVTLVGVLVFLLSLVLGTRVLIKKFTGQLDANPGLDDDYSAGAFYGQYTTFVVWYSGPVYFSYLRRG